MRNNSNILLAMIAMILFTAVLALGTIAQVASTYVDISRQMLELSTQQQADNAAMMDQVWAMIEAEQAPTEPPATMSREEAVEALREQIWREAEDR
jgi:hypothetical protein